VGKERKESKCDCKSVQGIEGEYLKSTMCAIGVVVGEDGEGGVMSPIVDR
jgi:hypothetical protein